MSASVRCRPEKVDFELADGCLPLYDVSDAVATVADADRETAWQALLEVDLLKFGREAPVVGMLGALRMLPEIVGHLLHGERPAKPPDSMRLRDLPSIPMAVEARSRRYRAAPLRPFQWVGQRRRQTACCWSTTRSSSPTRGPVVTVVSTTPLRWRWRISSWRRVRSDGGRRVKKPAPELERTNACPLGQR